MSFNWKNEEIKGHIDNLLKHINQIALQDDKITGDENHLIETVSNEMVNLKKGFERMKLDNLSIEEARRHTKILFEKVISSATSVAKEDKTITADELILIDRIAKYLRNIDLTELIN